MFSFMTGTTLDQVKGPQKSISILEYIGFVFINAISVFLFSIQIA